MPLHSRLTPYTSSAINIAAPAVLDICGNGADGGVDVGGGLWRARGLALALESIELFSQHISLSFQCDDTLTQCRVQDGTLRFYSSTLRFYSSTPRFSSSLLLSCITQLLPEHFDFALRTCSTTRSSTTRSSTTSTRSSSFVGKKLVEEFMRMETIVVSILEVWSNISPLEAAYMIHRDVAAI